jgi:hypothetical protein
VFWKDVLEEPVPHNGMKKLLTDYVLALWEHPPPL